MKSRRHEETVPAALWGLPRPTADSIPLCCPADVCLRLGTASYLTLPCSGQLAWRVGEAPRTGFCAAPTHPSKTPGYESLTPPRRADSISQGPPPEDRVWDQAGSWPTSFPQATEASALSKHALCVPPTVPQPMAAPSFQLLRPQALASSLSPLCLSHPASDPPGFPVGSAFKIHQKPKYFSHLHCRHPGQAAGLSPLDRSHGLPALLPASTCAHVPLLNNMSQIPSSSLQSPVMNAPILLQKPCSSKAAPFCPGSPLSCLLQPPWPAPCWCLQGPTIGPLCCCSSLCLACYADIHLASLIFPQLCCHVVSPDGHTRPAYSWLQSVPSPLPGLPS